MRIKKTNERTRLYIQNLSSRTRKVDILNVFEKYGKIINVHIPKDPETGNQRGFAFVEYEVPEHASAAHEKLHKYKLDGRVISILFAEPKESPNLYSPYPVSPDRYKDFDDLDFEDEPVTTWSKSQVATFLSKKTGIKDVYENFTENEITGEILFTLNSQDLKEMGFEKVGLRKRLEIEIQKLYNRELSNGNFNKEFKKKEEKKETPEQISSQEEDEEDHNTSFEYTGEDPIITDDFQINSQTIPTFLSQSKDEELPNFKEIAPKDFRTCPTLNCGYVFVMDDGATNFRCDKCHKSYCLKCNCLYHKNQTCIQYQKDLLNKKETIFNI